LPSDKSRAKKVEEATEGVLRWLGFLQQYALRVSFVDQFDDPSTDSDQPDCRVTHGYPYAWANLTCRRDVVDQADAETLEQLAVHEALHVLLFAPLDAFLRKCRTKKELETYNEQQERIVDLVSHYLERRRPKYGYHSSGVPNTKGTAKQPARKSVR